MLASSITDHAPGCDVASNGKMNLKMAEDEALEDEKAKQTGLEVAIRRKKRKRFSPSPHYPKGKFLGYNNCTTPGG